MKILLADRDPYELEALRSGLEGPDVKVTICEDGRDIVGIVNAEEPDVVVTNNQLRSMGAFAVSRELKMQGDVAGARPAPKVLILLERSADSWLANWSRSDRYLIKPVTPEEVMIACEELLAAGA